MSHRPNPTYFISIISAESENEDLEEFNKIMTPLNEWVPLKMAYIIRLKFWPGDERPRRQMMSHTDHFFSARFKSLFWSPSGNKKVKPLKSLKIGWFSVFCGFDHDVSLTDIKMDPNPLKIKPIKMVNPRKDDNKSVYFIQNFNIECFTKPNLKLNLFWLNFTSKAMLKFWIFFSKIAKTQDFMRV